VVEPKRQTLTDLFSKLGAREPERWAASQSDEGLPQVARFLFLRQAWRAVVDESDPQWIDGAISYAEAQPNEPYAGVGHALRALRGRGATDEELTDLVRGMQAELLFQFCNLLEDPGELEPEVADIGWALVQVDVEGDVVAAISGLHESVLETDPSGREMRPRGFRSYACSECGKVHLELPRFFIRKLPETRDGELINADEDHKSMCRTDAQCFVRCEVEVPLTGLEGEVLGFIGWVEVGRDDYERLLAFRADEEEGEPLSEWVDGTLANPVAGVRGSFGTAVKFEVKKGDPTPYIRWVEPGSTLAQRIAAGATSAFWHEVAASLR
jgi:hypothetical protein